MAKAQVGDLIRYIGNSDYFVRGAIYEVECASNNHVTVNNPGGMNEVCNDEYEIHRKAGEEDAVVVPAKATLHTREKVLPKHEAEAMLAEQDAVNSPNHYTQGRFETIEIIEEITQGYDDGYVAYCVGNALKYLARAPFKHGEPTEDIAKAAKYIEFALERLQTQK